MPVFHPHSSVAKMSCAACFYNMRNFGKTCKLLFEIDHEVNKGEFLLSKKMDNLENCTFWFIFFGELKKGVNFGAFILTNGKVC